MTVPREEQISRSHHQREERVWLGDRGYRNQGSSEFNNDG